MSEISGNIKRIIADNNQFDFTLVAVSKTKPKEYIQEAYDHGHLDFGENKVQELVEKHETLPKDIKWHMIGHLQRNKVKYIAPFVHLIHGVDSEKLLSQINKEAVKNDRVINCLLQVHIAEEDTKFGFGTDELTEFLNSESFSQYSSINIIGLMGMATNTSDSDQVKKEFRMLKELYDSLPEYDLPNLNPNTLSMGMSGDYKLALEEGSNMVRIGSAIFGARNYAK